MKFYSWSPEFGFMKHKTEEEAMKRAEYLIAEWRESEDDWTSLTAEVCWGEIKQQAFEKERMPNEESDGFRNFILIDVD